MCKKNWTRRWSEEWDEENQYELSKREHWNRIESVSRNHIEARFGIANSRQSDWEAPPSQETSGERFEYFIWTKDTGRESSQIESLGSWSLGRQNIAGDRGRRRWRRRHGRHYINVHTNVAWINARSNVTVSEDSVWRLTSSAFSKAISSVKWLMKISKTSMTSDQSHPGIRNHMSWKAYRDIITELLSISHGIMEHMILMTLWRENGDTTGRWLQRLRIDRQFDEDRKVVLSDKLYFDMTFCYLVKTKVITPPITKKITRDRCVKDWWSSRICSPIISWANFLDKICKIWLKQVCSVYDDEKRYHISMYKEMEDTRLYTLDQDIVYLVTFKGGYSAVMDQIETKDTFFRAPKYSECEKSGLTPRSCRHRTADCGPLWMISCKIHKANSSSIFLCPSAETRRFLSVVHKKCWIYQSKLSFLVIVDLPRQLIWQIGVTL